MRKWYRARLKRRRRIAIAQKYLRHAYAMRDDEAADRLFQRVLDLQAGRI